MELLNSCRCDGDKVVGTKTTATTTPSCEEVPTAQAGNLGKAGKERDDSLLSCPIVRAVIVAFVIVVSVVRIDGVQVLVAVLAVPLVVMLTERG